jgi:hypothetical protein
MWRPNIVENCCNSIASSRAPQSILLVTRLLAWSRISQSSLPSSIRSAAILTSYAVLHGPVFAVGYKLAVSEQSDSVRLAAERLKALRLTLMLRNGSVTGHQCDKGSE